MRDRLTARLAFLRRQPPEKARDILQTEAHLEMPPEPVLLMYLWVRYIRIRRRATSGFSGKVPFSWSDLQAFTAVTGCRSNAWELNVLERLDDLYMNPPEPENEARPGLVTANSGAMLKALTASIGKKVTIYRRNKDG